MFSCDFFYICQVVFEVNYNVGVWLMISIELLFGGLIEINYEFDDYVFVQNLFVVCMFKIVGVYENEFIINVFLLGDVVVSVVDEKNRDIFIKLDENYLNKNVYVFVGDEFYF